MSTNKLIDVDLLEYYDNKTRIREDEKINSIPFVNSMEYVKWYFDVHRDGKIYGVKFAYDANDCLVATGTKYGANANLVAQPSTRTVSGRNDYDEITVFKHFDANAHLDNNGNTIIDAIYGDKNFSYTGKVDVVCVFAPVYEKIYVGYESTTKYLYIEWCDTPRPGFTLNKLCKDGQGNNKGFYCITKFQAGLIDGVPYASARLYPWCGPFTDKYDNSPCYSDCVDTYHAKNEYMCAMTMAELSTIQRIFLMKYADTNFQKCLGGLTWSMTGLELISSIHNKNYVTMTNANADTLYTGVYVNIGTGTQRGNANAHDIACGLEIINIISNIVIFNSLPASFTIDNQDYTLLSTSFDAVVKIPTISGETAYDPNNDIISLDFSYNGNIVTINLVVEMNGTDYILAAYDNNILIGHSNTGIIDNSALILNDLVTFDLTSPKYLETSIAITGYSLDICGSDGCWINGDFTDDGIRPSVISGIEVLNGVCDVIGNAFCEYDSNGLPHVYVCNNTKLISNDSSEMTEYFTDYGIITHSLLANNWSYIHNITYNLENGVLIMNTGLGTTTKGFCDGCYIIYNQKSGQYTFLAFGALGSRLPKGIFSAALNHTLTPGRWDHASRPSLNGVMG